MNTEDAVIASEPVQPALRIVTGPPPSADSELSPPVTQEKQTRAVTAKRGRRVTPRNVAKVRQRQILDNFDELSGMFLDFLRKGCRNGDPRAGKMLGEVLGYLETASPSGSTINITQTNKVDASQDNRTIVATDSRGFENIVRRLEKRTSSVQLSNADAEIIEVNALPSAEPAEDIDKILDEFTL